LRFTHEDPKAQKYLLGGIEQVIALHKDALLPKVPGIFKVIILQPHIFTLKPPFKFSKFKLREVFRGGNFSMDFLVEAS